MAEDRRTAFEPYRSERTGTVSGGTDYGDTAARLAKIAEVLNEQTAAIGSSQEQVVGASGSNYVALPTERRTMTYILAESDFKIVAFTNTVSLASFAAASLFFSIFLTFLASWMFAEQMSAELLLITKVIMYISGVLSLILLGLGIINVIRRASHVKQIKKETKVKQ